MLANKGEKVDIITVSCEKPGDRNDDSLLSYSEALSDPQHFLQLFKIKKIF